MYTRVKAVALLRSVGVICAVMVVASGVTFAALQTQNVVLEGNRITSATANLLIGNGDGQFLSTTPGFAFDNVEPGGPPMPVNGNILHLRNSGTSDLRLKLALNPNALHNPNSVNLAKVSVVITPRSDGAVPHQFSLAALQTAYTSNTAVPLDITLPAGQDGEYSLQVVMAADAVGSITSSVSIYGLDMLFSGATQVQ